MAKAQLMGKLPRVSEDIVRSAKAPKFTDTWRPFSHAVVLDAIAEACRLLKIKVGKKMYSVTQSLARMFAVWELADMRDEEAQFAIGFRNATDKHFKIGICCGLNVNVCDNMILDSEFVLFRMHSGGLTQKEIVLLAAEALKLVLNQFDEFVAWHQELKKRKLTAMQGAHILIAAIWKGIIASANVPKFHDLYWGEKSKYEQDLHGWHGAMTELFKDHSLLSVQYKNFQLQRFVNYDVPLLLEYEKNALVDIDMIDGWAQHAYEADQFKKRDTKRLQTAEIRQRVNEELNETKVKKPAPKKAETKTKKKREPAKKVKEVVTGKRQQLMKCPHCQAIISKPKDTRGRYDCPKCGEELYL